MVCAIPATVMLGVLAFSFAAAVPNNVRNKVPNNIPSNVPNPRPRKR